MFTSRHLRLHRVGIAAASIVLATACNRELVRDLDGEQANLAVVELDRAGIPADKVVDDDGKGTFRVTVPRDQLAAAARALAAAELPRPARLGVQATFGKGSLVPTPLEERARLYAAIGADLERTLETFPAVERARVHLSIDTAALGETPAPPSAAVVLRLRARVPEPNADDIKRVVAKAAAGLDPARIDLVVARAPTEPAATASTTALSLGRERGVYLALGALFLVLLLSLGLLYASRRLQRERERETKTPSAPSPSKRLQPG